MRRSGDILGPLVTRLSAIGSLTEGDIDALLALPYTPRDGKAGWEVAREGDRPSQCCLILDGTFCRFKVAAQGARQIVSYHIRGDIPDLQSCFLTSMDHTLAALTSGTVAFIPHAAIRHILDENPTLGAKLLRESFIDSSISREWLCNVGRRSSESRLAHLICEMFTRNKAAGAADQFTFPFGLTQTAIGDSQGMSTVHVNRVLQKLRTEKLISSEFRSKTITILDWERLQEVGDFDPGYLHILN
jgi:CRP-like cAMP-binding protein